MHYVDVADAKELPGLRLALTRGLPGPWSQAAKYLFEVKMVPYVPMAQNGGGRNQDLFDWTGHRNAPIAVFDDEPARIGWHEILMLAERLGASSAPVLLPPTSAGRAEMLGIIAELASEGGLAWQRRLQLIVTLYDAAETSGDPRTRKAADALADRYGFSEQALSGATARITDILGMLCQRLRAQQRAGSDYLVGEGFTAADLYWACFSQLLAPMPEAQNPMPGSRRLLYQSTDPDVLAALDPALLAHRDRIYQHHLSLPLEF